MDHSALRMGCALCVLCIASFTMVTSEFAPIGLLSQIAGDLGRAPSTIGLTVTVYAWIGAASGLLSNWLNRWIGRKALLLALMLILALSNGLAALSPEFSLLLAARIVGALAHGVFWAIVAATAAHLVPVQRVGVATSIVLGGITIATVMGVPLVNLVGQYAGWRTAFACLALMCAVSAAAMMLVLPSMTIPSLAKGVGFGAILRRKDLLSTYFITGLTAAAHFGAYTFVEPFIGQVPGITSYMIAVLLFAFGAAGFLGNLLSALFIDRHLRALILLALVTMTLVLAVLGIHGPLLGVVPVVVLLVAWGVAISALFTGLQTWVLRIAGSHTLPATAIHTAVLNSAIGVGVIIGAQALKVAGVEGAMLVASAVVVPAIILMVVTGFRARGNPHSPGACRAVQAR